MFNPNYMQNIQRQYPQMYQPNFNQMYQPQMYQPSNNNGIQGRIVDNIDVVKATEISLDGSVNYFPLADGSAIVTKQLQMDGTSRIVIYKPVANETPKPITNEDLNVEISNLKEQIEELKNKFIKLEGVGENEKSETTSNEFFGYKSKSKGNA